MAGDGRRRRTRTVVAVTITAVVIGAMYAACLGLYFAAQHRSSAVLVKNENVPPDHLEALARTISFDPNKGDMVVRVEIRPEGSLAGPDGVSVTRAVSLDVLGGTGKASYRYNAGDRISPVDVAIGMNGDVNSYPFDSYTGFLVINAELTSPPDADPNAPVPVTTRLAFDGTLSGFRVNTRPEATDPAEANMLALDLTVKRAPVTAAFAILILILQGLLAVAAAALAVFIVRRHRRVEIPMLTWLAALLFAIIPLRNAMPNAPPIGAEIDVLVFFWVVTAIALALVSLLASWLRQPQAPAAPAAPPGPPEQEPPKDRIGSAS